jgi:hypothetical protein
MKPKLGWKTKTAGVVLMLGALVNLLKSLLSEDGISFEEIKASFLAFMTGMAAFGAAKKGERIEKALNGQ